MALGHDAAGVEGAGCADAATAAMQSVMGHRLALVALTLATALAAVAGALATTSACATTTPESLATARRERLEQFSAALAQAGLSVPLPPRLCEEPTTRETAAFDEDIGCVAAPPGARESDVVTVYARAVVARRVPDAEGRADELARAFLEGDPAFTALAVAIESEFDARRAALARAPKARASAKARAKHRPGVPVGDAGPRADGGPARGPPVSRAVSDDVDGRDAGVDIDAGPAALTVRERLIGTWATTKPSAIVHIHALCIDGGWRVTFEATNDVGRMVVGDLAPIHGSWEVTDGDPPGITLTAADGEKQQGTVAKLSDDVAELAIEGDDPEVIGLARRSKSAVCD